MSAVCCISRSAEANNWLRAFGMVEEDDGRSHRTEDKYDESSHHLRLVVGNLSGPVTTEYIIAAARIAYSSTSWSNKSRSVILGEAPSISLPTARH